MCESAIDPRSSCGLALTFQRGAGLGAAVNASLRSPALRGKSGGRLTEGTLISLRNQGAFLWEGIRVASFHSFDCSLLVL